MYYAYFQIRSDLMFQVCCDPKVNGTRYTRLLKPSKSLWKSVDNAHAFAVLPCDLLQSITALLHSTMADSQRFLSLQIQKGSTFPYNSPVSFSLPLRSCSFLPLIHPILNYGGPLGEAHYTLSCTFHAIVHIKLYLILCIITRNELHKGKNSWFASEFF